jgi:hypothetical protein
MRPFERLQQLIDSWWAEFLGNHSLGYCRDPQRQLLQPEIDDFDADAFLRGLDHGIFRVEDGFRILTELRPKKVDGSGTQFHLFEKVGTRCMLRQECMPHYAAAAELILDYEWPVAQVAIESPALPGLTAGALDLLVFSGGDQRTAVIGGEAKARRAQVERMLRDLRICGGARAYVARHSPDHKKCLALLAYRPQLFLAVAGGYRSVFPITYEERTFHLATREADPETLRKPR